MGCVLSILGEVGSNLPFLTPTLTTFAKIFRHRTAPAYFVLFQISSDEINFKVPLLDNVFLNRNLMLYLKVGCILSISGKKAQLYICRHPLWQLLQIFFGGPHLNVIVGEGAHLNWLEKLN